MGERLKRLLWRVGFDLVKARKSPRVHLLGLRGLPIRTVLDIGANAGQYARWVRRVHPAARVICFEPLPGAYRALSAWAATQGGAVTAVNAAIGDSTGEVEMFHHLDHDQSSSRLASADLTHAPQALRQEKIAVHQMTLDDAVAQLGQSLEPDLLVKADVQGYEDRVIRGGPKTFAAARACVLEVCVEPFYDGQARFDDLIELLAASGLRYGGNVSQSYDGDGRVLWFDALPEAVGSAFMAHTWSWKVLRAGRLRLDGGGMFGVVPRVIWERLTAPDAQNRIALQTNCLLLEDGSKRILVETGFGEKWSDKERGYWDLERRTVYDALAEAGCAPEEIDLVIVTHLHFDHAAALTRLGRDGAARPAFPNAQVVVQAGEWADACANRSTMTRTYLPSTTAPIASKLRLVEGEREVAPGIVVWPVPGHTWSMQAVRFDDGRGTVCFSGDVIPTVNHVNPAFSMGFDVMPWENMQTKRALLERATAEGWRLVLDHEPGPPVVRVEADAEHAGRHRLIVQEHPE